MLIFGVVNEFQKQMGVETETDQTSMIHSWSPFTRWSKEKTLYMLHKPISPLAFFFHMDVSKNRGNPKMDGLFHGKPYEQMDDLGGKPHNYFGFNPRIGKKKHTVFWSHL